MFIENGIEYCYINDLPKITGKQEGWWRSRLKKDRAAPAFKFWRVPNNNTSTRCMVYVLAEVLEYLENYRNAPSHILETNEKRKAKEAEKQTENQKFLDASIMFLTGLTITQEQREELNIKFAANAHKKPYRKRVRIKGEW